MTDVTVDVERLLSAARVPGSPNGFSAAEVRDLAIRYLGFHDEEVRKFPGIAGESHWNLWMSDRRFENALFAALVFRPDGAEFLCGTGDALAIKQFAESDFPDDVEQIPSELARLFTVTGGSLRLSREAAERWLGRGW